MSKQGKITLLILVLVLLVAAYFTYTYSQQQAKLNTDVAQTLGTEEEDAYTTLGGEPIALEEFDGSVRVVNSWASWSPFSRVELFNLNKLAAAYGDQGVEVIAINRSENPERAKVFLNQLGDLSNLNVLLDGGDVFYERMDGYSMPETLFFDRDGNIVRHIRGDLSYVKMVEYVEEALAAN